VAVAKAKDEGDPIYPLLLRRISQEERFNPIVKGVLKQAFVSLLVEKSLEENTVIRECYKGRYIAVQMYVNGKSRRSARLKWDAAIKAGRYSLDKRKRKVVMLRMPPEYVFRSRRVVKQDVDCTDGVGVGISKADQQCNDLIQQASTGQFDSVRMDKVFFYQDAAVQSDEDEEDASDDVSDPVPPRNGRGRGQTRQGR